MATTAKFTLRVNKRRSDGTVPIYLRITMDRRSRYIATGIYIAPRFWNAERQSVRRNHDLSGTYNAKLHDLRMETERYRLDAVSAHEVKQRITGTGGSLTDYLEQYINRLDQSKRYWSWKRYRVVREKLRGCFGKQLDWSDLDLPRLESYMADVLGNGPNTIPKDFGWWTQEELKEFLEEYEVF